MDWKSSWQHSLCNSPNRSYRALAEEAGVRPIGSHGVRHTSGSSYAVMGVGQKMIAFLFGHMDPAHVKAAEATAGLVEERWRRLVERE